MPIEFPTMRITRSATAKARAASIQPETSSEAPRPDNRHAPYNINLRPSARTRATASSTSRQNKKKSKSVPAVSSADTTEPQVAPSASDMHVDEPEVPPATSSTQPAEPQAAPSALSDVQVSEPVAPETNKEHDAAEASQLPAVEPQPESREASPVTRSCSVEAQAGRRPRWFEPYIKALRLKRSKPSHTTKKTYEATNIQVTQSAVQESNVQASPVIALEQEATRDSPMTFAPLPAHASIPHDADSSLPTSTNLEATRNSPMTVAPQPAHASILHGAGSILPTTNFEGQAAIAYEIGVETTITDETNHAKTGPIIDHHASNRHVGSPSQPNSTQRAGHSSNPTIVVHPPATCIANPKIGTACAAEANSGQNEVLSGIAQPDGSAAQPRTSSEQTANIAQGTATYDANADQEMGNPQPSIDDDLKGVKCQWILDQLAKNPRAEPPETMIQPIEPFNLNEYLKDPFKFSLSDHRAAKKCLDKLTNYVSREREKRGLAGENTRPSELKKVYGNDVIMVQRAAVERNNDKGKDKATEGDEEALPSIPTNTTRPRQAPRLPIDQMEGPSRLSYYSPLDIQFMTAAQQRQREAIGQSQEFQASLRAVMLGDREDFEIDPERLLQQYLSAATRRGLHSNDLYTDLHTPIDPNLLISTPWTKTNAPVNTSRASDPARVTRAAPVPAARPVQVQPPSSGSHMAAASANTPSTSAAPTNAAPEQSSRPRQRSRPAKKAQFSLNWGRTTASTSAATTSPSAEQCRHLAKHDVYLSGSPVAPAAPPSSTSAVTTNAAPAQNRPASQQPPVSGSPITASTSAVTNAPVQRRPPANQRLPSSGPPVNASAAIPSTSAITTNAAPVQHRPARQHPDGRPGVFNSYKPVFLEESVDVPPPSSGAPITSTASSRKRTRMIMIPQRRYVSALPLALASTSNAPTAEHPTAQPVPPAAIPTVQPAPQAPPLPAAPPHASNAQSAASTSTSMSTDPSFEATPVDVTSQAASAIYPPAYMAQAAVPATNPPANTAQASSSAAMYPPANMAHERAEIEDNGNSMIARDGYQMSEHNPYDEIRRRSTKRRRRESTNTDGGGDDHDDGADAGAGAGAGPDKSESNNRDKHDSRSPSKKRGNDDDDKGEGCSKKQKRQ